MVTNPDVKQVTEIIVDEPDALELNSELLSSFALQSRGFTTNTNYQIEQIKRKKAVPVV